MSEEGFNRGYVLLHRKLLDSTVFVEESLLQLWIYCLLRAAHKVQHVSMTVGKGKKIVTLQPGQFVTGRHTGAKDLGCPASTYWRRLQALQDLDMLRITPDSHWSIVTIQKWRDYQATEQANRQRIASPNGDLGGDAGQANEQANRQRIASPNASFEGIGGQATDRLRTGYGQATDTYKNANNSKNAKKRERAFAPPTLEEVKSYWIEEGLSGDPEEFFDHFQSNGWKVSGKTAMKDWRASARNWSRRESKFGKADSKPQLRIVEETELDMFTDAAPKRRSIK